MNVKSKENQENSAIELVIEVGAEEFETAVDKIYRKNRKSIAVPGFRKGHAPRKIIEGMYGSGVFYEDAVDELYPAAYAQAVEQEGLEPVSYPKVEVLEVGKEGFTFKALVTVKPEYKINEYKGLTAKKETVTLTDEDIENELKPFIQRATRLVTTEGEAKEGNTVLIDFEGFDNGVPFEGGKAENHTLELGSNSFIPGFEEGLVGLKAGDEKDLEITFPEDYSPELAGKPVIFKIKVHEVKESQAPVIDDEFAKDVSEFDTMEELKKDLSTKLQERRQSAADRAFDDAIVDALIANLEVELPQAMVEFRADQVLQDYANRFEQQGIAFQQYLQMTGQTLDTMKEQSKAAAEHQIKSEMALDAVAAAEKLEVSDEDMEVEFKAMAEQYSMELEQVKAAAPAEDVKVTLQRRKAMELVKENAEAEAEAVPESKPKAKAKKAPAKKAAAAATEEVAPETEAPKKKTTRSKKSVPEKTEE